MSRSKLALAVAAVVLLAAGSSGATWYLTRDGDSSAGPTTSAASVDPITSLELRYPSGWTSQPLSGVDRRAGLVAKAERAKPAASFLARVVATGAGDELRLDRLAQQTERALAAGIQGFTAVDRDVVEVSGVQVVRLVYRQTISGQPPAQSVLVVLPTREQTLYLTVRAAADVFAGLSGEADSIIAAAVEAAVGD